ncbi:hypothetical protein GCM10025734_05960 [Kitasatospora paranensis]
MMAARGANSAAEKVLCAARARPDPVGVTFTDAYAKCGSTTKALGKLSPLLQHQVELPRRARHRARLSRSHQQRGRHLCDALQEPRRPAQGQYLQRLLATRRRAVPVTGASGNLP